jgi:p-cumate 2,3-dioxygenase subunit beta
MLSPSKNPVTDDATLRAVEQFIYSDAALLDAWRLHEWIEYFTVDARYLVPATDKPDGDPDRDLYLISDDRFLLEQRINSLLTRAAHAEYPHSRTRRLITNVRVVRRNGDHLDVEANFVIFRIRAQAMDTYVGHYEFELERDASLGFRFRTRKAVLDLDSLRAQGKVSIIL